MAKYIGEGRPPFVGTREDLTIYKFKDGEQYYVRQRSSITTKRIKKDRVFAGFRNSSVRMKDASPIASEIYRQMPVKEYVQYREITGKALLLLKAGYTAEEVKCTLMAEYLPVEETPVITLTLKRFYRVLPLAVCRKGSRSSVRIKSG